MVDCCHDRPSLSRIKQRSCRSTSFLAVGELLAEMAESAPLIVVVEDRTGLMPSPWTCSPT